MPNTEKWSNERLCDMIENEGFEYFVLMWGPPTPEELEDETLKGKWAKMLTISLEWKKAQDDVLDHLGLDT